MLLARHNESIARILFRFVVSLKRDVKPGDDYFAAPLLTIDGVLYGTTGEGGASDGGVVFALTP